MGVDGDDGAPGSWFPGRGVAKRGVAEAFVGDYGDGGDFGDGCR
jgi:hypothetical protein